MSCIIFLPLVIHILYKKADRIDLNKLINIKKEKNKKRKVKKTKNINKKKEKIK